MEVIKCRKSKLKDVRAIPKNLATEFYSPDDIEFISLKSAQYSLFRDTEMFTFVLADNRTVATVGIDIWADHVELYCYMTPLFSEIFSLEVVKRIREIILSIKKDSRKSVVITAYSSKFKAVKFLSLLNPIDRKRVNEYEVFTY